MKCKYALKALIYLGKNHGKGYLEASAIADERNIPKKFLEQILLKLKYEGLIISKQGIGGGYCLAKHPTEITVADVFRIFDGAIALVPCASLKFYKKCDDCFSESECLYKPQFIKIGQGARLAMSKTSIQSFINTGKSNKSKNV